MRERHGSQAITLHLVLLGVGDRFATHDARSAGATPQRRDATGEEKATFGEALPDSLTKVLLCVTATADASQMAAALRA
jgi:hypothetical protein